MLTLWPRKSFSTNNGRKSLAVKFRKISKGNYCILMMEKLIGSGSNGKALIFFLLINSRTSGKKSWLFNLAFIRWLWLNSKTTLYNIRYYSFGSRNQCRRYLRGEFSVLPHFKFDGRRTTQMAHMRYLVILVLLYATLVYSQQLSIFVSVDGSDVTGDGSMNKPFQTISAAQNFIKINVTKANYNGTF